MVDESDGISEAFEEQLRVAVTAGGRVGEIIARQREKAARRAQAASQQHARELASRFDAERQSARAQLSVVHRNEWWEHATPKQIGATLATARAWGGEDPEAMRAEGRMREELRTRYGLNAHQAGGDPQAVGAAVDAELSRRQSETKQQHGTSEETKAALLMREADRADRQADTTGERVRDVLAGSDERTQAREEAQSYQRAATSARVAAGSTYDSVERRKIEASKLHAQGVEGEAVAARMSADLGNAKPATEAVKGTPGVGVRARPAQYGAARVHRDERAR
ncbi:hypothetical protein [Microbacterium sp. LMI1-1-1.1]|uniref:hypothetical protein n=1 Tax=Microbacterium sp. LMI1-1-1.1 TaxID=3135223 RepID=UPI003466EC9F